MVSLNTTVANKQSKNIPKLSGACVHHGFSFYSYIITWKINTWL